MSGFSERFLAGAVIVIALCTGFTQAGCDSDDSTTPAGLIAVWQLQEFILDDGTTIPVDDPAKYTIDFQPDGMANIRADCNGCSGPYMVDGSRLTFGLMACTAAACPPGSFFFQFASALGTVSSFEITGGSLFLDYEGGELRLTPVPTLFQ
jgi:heat shock protein HslJ